MKGKDLLLNEGINIKKIIFNKDLKLDMYGESHSTFSVLSIKPDEEVGNIYIKNGNNNIGIIKIFAKYLDLKKYKLINRNELRQLSNDEILSIEKFNKNLIQSEIDKLVKNMKIK